MVKITINYEKCDFSNCGECADVCPMEVLIVEGEKIEIKCPKVQLMRNLHRFCPDNALIIEDVT